jgi:hypothetical protein
MSRNALRSRRVPAKWGLHAAHLYSVSLEVLLWCGGYWDSRAALKALFRRAATSKLDDRCHVCFSPIAYRPIGLYIVL